MFLCFHFNKNKQSKFVNVLKGGLDAVIDLRKNLSLKNFKIILSKKTLDFIFRDLRAYYSYSNENIKVISDNYYLKHGE